MFERLGSAKSKQPSAKAPSPIGEAEESTLVEPTVEPVIEQEALPPAEPAVIIHDEGSLPGETSTDEIEEASTPIRKQQSPQDTERRHPSPRPTSTIVAYRPSSSTSHNSERYQSHSTLDKDRLRYRRDRSTNYQERHRAEQRRTRRDELERAEDLMIRADQLEQEARALRRQARSIRHHHHYYSHPYSN